MKTKHPDRLMPQNTHAFNENYFLSQYFIMYIVFEINYFAHNNDFICALER